MKIKFTTSLAGADFVRSPGEVAEVENTEAARLVAAGYAVPAKSAGKTEKAASRDDADETAVTNP